MCKTRRLGSSDYDQYGSCGFDKSPNGRLESIDTQVAGGCCFPTRSRVVQPVNNNICVSVCHAGGARRWIYTGIGVSGHGFLPHGCVFVWTRL